MCTASRTAQLLQVTHHRTWDTWRHAGSIPSPLSQPYIHLALLTAVYCTNREPSTDRWASPPGGVRLNPCDALLLPSHSLLTRSASPTHLPNPNCRVWHSPVWSWSAAQPRAHAVHWDGAGAAPAVRAPGRGNSWCPHHRSGVFLGLVFRGPVPPPAGPHRCAEAKSSWRAPRSADFPSLTPFLGLPTSSLWTERG